MATPTATDSTRAAAPGADEPRQRYARGEGDRLRTDLLQAATDLMAETGTVEGTSLRAVARRAGVSPTAVYRHFDDHTELLRETVAYCWINFGQAMTDARDGGTDIFDSFRRCGDAYVDFALNHQGQYRVMFSNRIQVDGAKDSVGMSTFDLLVDVVREMLDALDDDRDPFFVAVQIHTWIHGIVDLVGCHPDMAWPPSEELLDELQTALRLDPPTG